MNKKKKSNHLPELDPQIIEIKEKEIEEKKPPIKNIVYYKLINKNNSSKLKEEK
ncbi:MAG: hypothetical protein ACFFCM_19635 [Promethearchaeota archaeon]